MKEFANKDDQKRAPAGQSNGGQFVSQGGGSGGGSKKEGSKSEGKEASSAAPAKPAKSAAQRLQTAQAMYESMTSSAPLREKAELREKIRGLEKEVEAEKAGSKPESPADRSKKLDALNTKVEEAAKKVRSAEMEGLRGEKMLAVKAELTKAKSAYKAYKEGGKPAAVAPAHAAAAASPGFEKVAEGDVYRVRQLLAQMRLYGDQMKPKEFSKVRQELESKGYSGKIQIGNDTATKIRQSGY